MSCSWGWDGPEMCAVYMRSRKTEVDKRNKTGKKISRGPEKIPSAMKAKADGEPQKYQGSQKNVWHFFGEVAPLSFETYLNLVYKCWQMTKDIFYLQLIGAEAAPIHFTVY